MADEKIERSTFVFMRARKPEGTFAQCVGCTKFIPELQRCVEFSASDVVTGEDSCCLYSPGANAVGKTPTGSVSPKEAGFVRRKVRCENCRFFDPNDEPQKHCDLYTQLNLILPHIFDLDRYVQEYDCCNAQTPGTRDPTVFGPFGPVEHDNLGAADSAALLVELLALNRR